MTVQEVIAYLQTLDPSLKVQVVVAEWLPLDTEDTPHIYGNLAYCDGAVLVAQTEEQ